MVLAAFVGEQCCVGTVLDDSALVEYHDLVAEFAGRQPVGDIDGSLIPGDAVEFLVDLRLGDGVQGRRRLVKDDKGCILVQRPCDGNFLGFTAGDRDTGLIVILVEIGVEPVGKLP